MVKLNHEKEKPNSSHFSHEHPLELTSLCETGNTICSGCKFNMFANKAYYTCKTCNYSLHGACYNMPRIFQHAADPGHDLNLLVMPFFECKACGLQDSGFSYKCSTCLVHYHMLCLLMPPTKKHSAHSHMLKLEFSPPYDDPKAFRCDICGNPGYDHWLYHCGECDFDVHVTCIAATQAPTMPGVGSVQGSRD